MATQPRKSKGVAALLAILVGFVGADDFYIHNNMWGIVRLVIFAVAFLVGMVGSFVTFLITFFLVFLPLIFVLTVWDVVNFFRYLTMSDERFQQMVAANRGG